MEQWQGAGGCRVGVRQCVTPVFRTPTEEVGLPHHTFHQKLSSMDDDGNKLKKNVVSRSASVIVAAPLAQLHCLCPNGAQMRIIRGLVCE